ncbi:uncharacterized protein SCHCODRAFT_02030703 [Schizophyllum commune H4-8]|uniref:uncharacterized protein n=1 Tax=Schizophyllum commune (strain H4-8 / FGSC 9210) TaxID=578458 RepID=UPI00215DD943|nr:uncharacterized protein SCHCODRAFT_02030703 [Schizophyllum commune H4-8]KAI5900183.1 hypothetical protein SCHCODRAFT_02030703 [Schizophyllum commune H4-8]
MRMSTTHFGPDGHFMRPTFWSLRVGLLYDTVHLCNHLVLLAIILFYSRNLQSWTIDAHY